MANSNSADRTSKLDDESHKAIKDLLIGMIAVEDEMTTFSVHVAAQNVQDQPLNRWPTYTGYRNLATVSKTLSDTTARIKALVSDLSFAQCNVGPFVAQARHISLKVSTDVSSTMKILNEKAAKYISETNAESNQGQTNDIATAVIIGALGEIIKHSTEAANHVWAALDLLESLSCSPPGGKKPATADTRHRIPWICWASTAFLLCVALLNGSSVSGNHGNLQLPGYGAKSHVEGVIIDMKNTCSLMNQNLQASALIQNATLTDINRRFQTLEKAFESNSERIDSLWEALGPPNSDGTYFTTATSTEQTAVSDARFRKLQSSLQEQLEQMKADALAFKRQVQRSEVRLHTRLGKLEPRMEDGTKHDNLRGDFPVIVDSRSLGQGRPGRAEYYQ
ncbi:hypothetical protein BU23DRAFT_573603 [Bimuria novae-zelandiae CBS 107.79]|uniref:Uncharacterized protein n=1 Tax=Bimuria novae-zelandiae CBS 107.79 TaxID=1447943 RepID=A0A6A5UT79_9PLEO|nr:hypothetical protein BU23DRAFT_573603 [Bimuria novae-zelandiae CBS 107.79]